MKKQKNWVKIKVRRRILSMGNPICCPSVTYNKKAIDENLFDQQFKNATDWDAWERLSNKKGAFIYISECLMAHRVHADSTTSANIKNHTRTKEDKIIFSRFWPKGVAILMAKVFSLSEKNNG